MKTGDTVTDGGRSYTVGEMLGRGLWGTSWSVRDASGRELVLKVPLAREDLPADAPVPDGLLAACRKAAAEQAELLRKGDPWLPKLEAEIPTESGPGLLLPRYPTTLKRKLAGGVPLSDAIALLRGIVVLLQEARGRIHGNLRPANVLVNERGEPVLADVLTPALFPWRARLQELTPGRDAYHPPEGGEAPRPGWDTWAITSMLYRAAMAPGTPSANRDPRREERVVLPREGIDKVGLAALRDRVLARLKEDPKSNPRFAPRLAERFGSLLNRALSLQTEPSPPYRFVDAADLRPRLDEVFELIDPGVEEVGHFLLAPGAKNGVFTGEAATFSVTIGCSSGISGHEDVACGLQIRDLDVDEEDARVPVPDTRFSVKAHPSGRLRFDFTVPALPPGRYRASIAFTIKESEHEPRVATGDFEVRPPPGYVPPPDELPSGAVPLQLPRKSTGPAEPVAPGAGGSAEVFPLPLAPSAPPEAAAAAPRPMAVEVEFEPTVGPEAASDPSLGTLPSFGSDPGDEAFERASASSGAAAAVAPPPIAMVKPAARVHTPAPSIAPPAIPSDSGLNPPSDPSLPLGDRPTHPSVEPPPTWNRPPVDYDDVSQGGALDAPYLPGPQGGEDLPSWADQRPHEPTSAGFAAIVERGIEYVRRDTYTAFMLFVGSGLGFLLVAFLLLRACS